MEIMKWSVDLPVRVLQDVVGVVLANFEMKSTLGDRFLKANRYQLEGFLARSSM
jgi:hypothetical protein